MSRTDLIADVFTMIRNATMAKKENVDVPASNIVKAILEILNNLKKMIEEGVLQLESKKKEKSLEEINKLNRAFIEQFLKKYSSFRAEINEIETKIRLTGVAEKFKHYNMQLEEINLDIEKLNDGFDKAKNDVAKIINSIESLKNEIESNIKLIFGQAIKILV